MLKANNSYLIPGTMGTAEDMLRQAADFESACAVEQYNFDPVATELLKEAKAKAAGR